VIEVVPRRTEDDDDEWDEVMKASPDDDLEDYEWEE
jgi:hypothetical protein